MKNRASKAGLLGCVLIASGVLLAALAVFFVPESAACLPGFKPKPGVTNPTVNERDCEPISQPSTSPPPSTPDVKRRKAPPLVPPSVGRGKAEELLRQRQQKEGDWVPPGMQPQRPSDGDDAIRRLGEKLRGTPPAGRPDLKPLPPGPGDSGCSTAAAGPAAEEWQSVRDRAQAELGATYEEASDRLLQGHPVMERLERTRRVYTQVLAENPGLPRRASSAPPGSLWGKLSALVRLVGSHGNALEPKSQGVAVDPHRRAEWAVRYEAAADDLLRADQERRSLIDAFVATPEEAVGEMLAMARSFGRIPLHPLVPPLEVGTAERLFASVAENADRLALLGRAAAGEPPRREERERVAESLYRELAPPPASPKGLKPLPLDREEREVARHLADRLFAVRDQVLAAVGAGRAAGARARSEGERAAARAVGAQVLYAEVAGKEALIEGQKAPSATSRVVDVIRTAAGLERRLMVDGAADLVRIEPVPTVPAQTVEKWRGSLSRAKSEIARAQVALLQVEHAAPIQKMLLDRNALGRRLEGEVSRLATRGPAVRPDDEPAGLHDPGISLLATRGPAVRPDLLDKAREIRNLPETRAEFDRLQSYAAQLKTITAPGAREVVRYLEDETTRLKPALAQKEQAAAALSLEDDRVRGAVQEWKRASEETRQRIGEVAQNPSARAEAANRAAAAETGYRQALQRLALPLLPGPEEFKPAPPLAPLSGRGLREELAERARRDDSFRVVEQPSSERGRREELAEQGRRDASSIRRPPEKPGLREGLASPERRDVLRAGSSAPGGETRPQPKTWQEISQYVHQRTQDFNSRRTHAPAGGEAYNRWVAEDKAFHEELRKDVVRMSGAGKDLSWQEIWRTMPSPYQGPTAYGAVFTRDQLNDPDFLAQLYKARLGGWGWVHQFKNAEEYKRFIESRLAGYGIVHNRSDLSDPKYLEALYKARLGGWGWVHTFKDENELRDFVQSRLGGMGRAYTCNDLQRLGWKPDQVKQIFDEAQKYAKKPFESDDAYRARMLKEYPGEFIVDENGQFRRKTLAEKQAELKAERLKTGKFVEDPRTGRLIAKDSIQGQALVAQERARTTTTVEIRLADGRTVKVPVEKGASFYDAASDTLMAQGFTRNAKGDWVDRRGNVVLEASKYLGFDKRYTDEKQKTDPEFEPKYRKPPELIPTPPPTPAQELAKLQNDIKNTLGFEVRNLDVGGKKPIDLQVKPGQKVSDALLEHFAAEGRKVVFDDSGNLIDQTTRKTIMPWKQVLDLNREYDKKLTEAVFGAGNSGFTRDVAWLAEHGSPTQKARAQEIIQQSKQQLQHLADARKSESDFQARLAAMGDRSSLNAKERADYDRLARALDGASQQRREIESGLIEQTKVTNASAKNVITRDLGYNERQAVQANAEANRLAGEIADIDRRLREEALGPTARRDLERMRARRVEELVRAERKQEESEGQLARDGGTDRVSALTTRVDNAAVGVTATTVLNRGEALAQARGVVIAKQGGKDVAYATSADGLVLRDPAGRPIQISKDEARGVERRLKQEAEARAKAEAQEQVRRATALALQEELANRALKRVLKKDESIKRYDEQIAALKGKPGSRERIASLERARDRLEREAEADRDVVRNFQRQYAGLTDAGRKEFDTRSNRLKEARAQREKEYLEGHVAEEVDKDGNVRLLRTKRQEEYQEEQRQKKEAEERARREQEEAKTAKARAEEEQKKRAAEEARRRDEAQHREAAERKAAEERQERRIQQEALNGLAAQAERKRRDAEAGVARAEEAARKNKTEATMAELDRAKRDLAKANQEEMATRLAAMAGTTDPGIFQSLAAQQTAIQDRGAALDALERARVEAERLMREVSAKAARGEATSDDVARARDAWQARVTAAVRGQAELKDAEKAYERMIDGGLYGLASREANRARLEELDRREKANRDAGRFPYAGFTDAEREEQLRRMNLERYHARVAEAADKAARLEVLREQRGRGEKLSPEEERLIERGLTPQESAILVGDRQRRERLAGLRGEPDLERKAREVSSIEEWMRSLDGAAGGRYVEGSTQRVPRTPAEWDAYRAEQQQKEQAGRAAEGDRQAAAVQAAIEKNREIDRKIEEFDREAAAGWREREQNIATLREDLDRERRRVERLRQMRGGSLTEANADRQIAETERRIQNLEQTLHRDLIRNMEPDKRVQAADQLAADDASLEREIRGTREQIRRGTVDAPEGEARIKNLEEARTRRAAELQDYRTLPSAPLKDAERRAAIEAERPAAWTYDPAEREQQEMIRNQRAIALSAERQRLEQEANAAVAAAETRVREAREAVERKEREILEKGYRPDALIPGLGRPPQEETDALNELRRRLRDAEAGRSNVQGVRERQVDQAEREERAEFERNRRDGIGPAGTYDVRKAAEARGLDYDLLVKADVDRLRTVEESAVRVVETAQRQKLTAEGPSLLTETLKEVQWSNLLDPVWKARTVVNSEIGAAKGLAHLVADTAKMVGGATYEGARLLVSQQARNEAEEKLVNAIYTVRELGGAGVSRAFTQALGQAGSEFMQGLVGKDGKPDEAKIAEAGGNLGLQLGLLFVGGGSAGSGGRFLSSAALRAEGEAALAFEKSLEGLSLLERGAARTGRWAASTLERSEVVGALVKGTELGIGAAERGVGAARALPDVLASLPEAASAARRLINEPGALLRGAGELARAGAVAGGELAYGLGKADVVESWGRLKAGYGALDTTATAAEAASDIRRAAAAKTFERLVQGGSEARETLAAALRAPERAPPAARRLDFDLPPVAPPGASRPPRFPQVLGTNRPPAHEPVAPAIPRQEWCNTCGPALARGVIERATGARVPEKDLVRWSVLEGKGYQFEFDLERGVGRGGTWPKGMVEILEGHGVRTRVPYGREFTRPGLSPTGEVSVPGRMGAPTGRTIAPDPKLEAQLQKFTLNDAARELRDRNQVLTVIGDPKRQGHWVAVEEVGSGQFRAPDGRLLNGPYVKIGDPGTGASRHIPRAEFEKTWNPQSTVVALRPDHPEAVRAGLPRPARAAPEAPASPPQVAARPPAGDTPIGGAGAAGPPPGARRPDAERPPGFETQRVPQEEILREARAQAPTQRGPAPGGEPARTPELTEPKGFSRDLKPTGDRPAPAPPVPAPGPVVAAVPPAGPRPFHGRLPAEPPRHALDELVDAKIVNKDALKWLRDQQKGLPALQRESDALTAQLSKLSNPASRAKVEARLKQIQSEIETKRPAAREAIEGLGAATRRLEGTKVTIRDASGAARDVELGAYIGGGLNGHVFAVRGDSSQVVKLFTDRGTDPKFMAEAIKGQMDGLRTIQAMGEGRRVPVKPVGQIQKLRVGDQDVVVLPMTRVREDARALEVAKGRAAWQDLPEGAEYRLDFGARAREAQLGSTRVDASTPQRMLSREEQRAVLGMYDNLAAEKVVWLDGHLDNLYFIRTQSGLKAGILDTDRIAHLDKPGAYLTGWLKDAFGMDRSLLTPDQAILSMFKRKPDGTLVAIDRGWAGKDKGAGFVMQKMLEHRGWVKYDIEGGVFEAELIDPALTRQFERLNLFGPSGGPRSFRLEPGLAVLAA